MSVPNCDCYWAFGGCMPPDPKCSICEGTGFRKKPSTFKWLAEPRCEFCNQIGCEGGVKCPSSWMHTPSETTRGCGYNLHHDSRNACGACYDCCGSPPNPDAY